MKNSMTFLSVLHYNKLSTKKRTQVRHTFLHLKGETSKRSSSHKCPFSMFLTHISLEIFNKDLFSNSKFLSNSTHLLTFHLYSQIFQLC